MAREFEIRRKEIIREDGTTITDITPVKVTISDPTVPTAYKLTKEDVWGNYDENTYKMLTKGMIVAHTGEKCPVFKDVLGYKDVTVICTTDQETEVQYWLEYVHGANCITKRKELDNNKVALRSEYQCW